MEKKAIIVATLYSFVSQFEKNDIKILKELGYKVYLAANINKTDSELESLIEGKLDLKFTRNPISTGNIKSIFKLYKYLKNNKFDLMHCHTPVGGVIGRLTGKLAKVKTIIYTAHGFHFFKGAPLKNWILFYPIEKILSKFTDILITINKEDFKRVQKFHSKKVEYIPGVGIDIEKIKNVKVNIEEKRKELGINAQDKVLISVGELIDRKNHILPIKALGKIKDKNLKYLICGEGPLKTKLVEECKKEKIEEEVKFLGFRKDIYELCKISDLFIFPSKQEGLPVALMEAIAVNIPIVCSNIRGNIDLVEDYRNGILLDNDENEYKKNIEMLIKKNRIYAENKTLLSKIDIKNIEKKMKEIYEKIGREY